jgi:hypothetical protein
LVWKETVKKYLIIITIYYCYYHSHYNYIINYHSHY